MSSEIKPSHSRLLKCSHSEQWMYMLADIHTNIAPYGKKKLTQPSCFISDTAYTLVICMYVLHLDKAAAAAAFCTVALEVRKVTHTHIHRDPFSTRLLSRHFWLRKFFKKYPLLGKNISTFWKEHWAFHTGVRLSLSNSSSHQQCIPPLPRAPFLKKNKQKTPHTRKSNKLPRLNYRSLRIVRQKAESVRGGRGWRSSMSHNYNKILSW